MKDPRNPKRWFYREIERERDALQADLEALRRESGTPAM
jgi:hypothetical protein